MKPCIRCDNSTEPCTWHLDAGVCCRCCEAHYTKMQTDEYRAAKRFGEIPRSLKPPSVRERRT